MARKIISVIALIILLPGCGAMGAYFDHQDPCQTANRGPAYQMPTFCGASASRNYIYNMGNSRVGYVNR